MPDQLELISLLYSPREVMSEGAMLLRGIAMSFGKELLAAVNDIATSSPFRRMVTPGGYAMSVGMTNCGAVGWVSDREGYRYDRIDPETGRSWPTMPNCFLDLAVTAANEAGYAEFRPDACLINRYESGARLSLHQHKDERDLANPVVSVSLGLPSTFQFGARGAMTP
jgi:alkylated DNA repair protein (DNA oxidative demethylase)